MTDYPPEIHARAQALGVPVEEYVKTTAGVAHVFNIQMRELFFAIVRVYAPIVQRLRQ